MSMSCEFACALFGAPRRPRQWMIAATWAAFLGFTGAAGSAGAEVTAGNVAPEAQRTPLSHVHPSMEVRAMVDWILRTHDNGNGAFLIVDKRNARLFAFDPGGHALGDAPVLLGAARGDDSVPGIGERKIADIKVAERTTPAGRFVGEAGRNLRGEDVVWIDYDAAVSMHRVLTTNPRERRLERLATPTIADNRISYGCINVPVAFFEQYVSPVFSDGKRAIVYVLPETRSLAAQFHVPELARATTRPKADALQAGHRARLASVR